MRIHVFGARGLLGNAISTQLASRGHTVLRAARTGADLAVDFRFDSEPGALRAAVRGADVVVNAAGILIERDGNTFDGVHRRASEALAAACEAERVARIIHVSALGVGTGIPGPFMASKLAAELAYAKHGVDFAVVRVGLLVDEACPSTRLFRWLSRLPVVALPGVRHPGASPVAPIQVADVARCIAAIIEHPKALRRVIELAGTETMPYRQMLERYRAEHAAGRALLLPIPWWLMKLTARLAQRLPQKVFSIDTMRMLQAGSVSHRNEAVRWLGCEPAPMLPVRAGTPARSATMVV